MATLEEEEVPGEEKVQLMPRSDGPFEILEKIGPNAYKVDLSHSSTKKFCILSHTGLRMGPS